MPTQVRLTTDNTNANFDSNFVEEIFIPKNSKIALNTFCMESSLKSFVINGNNETFSLRCRDSDGNGNFLNNNLYNNLTLRNGGYNDKTDLDALFTALKKRLNEIDLTGLTQSLTFSVSNSDDDNYFSLYPFKTPLSSFVDSAFYIGTEYTGGNSGVFKKTANTDANNFDNYISYANSLQKGIGRTILQIGILTGGGGNAPPSTGTEGILMALVEKQPASDGSTSYAFSDVKYGIYLNNQSSTYYTVYNGAETNTLQSIEGGSGNNADFMSIEKVGTNFVYKIYQPAFNGAVGRTLTIATQPIGNVNTNYYPVIFFKGAGNTAQAQTVATTFDLSDDEELSISLNHNELTGSVPSNEHNPRLDGFQATFPIQITITFQKSTTAKFLGFNSLTKTAFENQGDLQDALRGDNEIQYLVEADYHIVVLDNIKLKAYDGITNSRQNILAYIPKAEGENGEVVYEPNNLYYVDLDNREDLKIKNIRARILDKELNPIQTNGLSVFSFLIN